MFELFKVMFGKGSTSLLSKARDEFLEMLDLACELLREVQPHLLERDAPPELSSRARDVDKISNKLERSIRKLLVEHLAFAHADASACLVLMSVAKDGERIVDECRNLFELRERVEAPVPERYAESLRELTEELAEELRKTRRSFAASDAALALDLVEGEKPFQDRIRAVQDLLLADPSLTGRQAIVASRAFQLLHRMRAHVGNIASTVVFPVHRIDFVKRSFIEDARRELAGKPSRSDDD